MSFNDSSVPPHPSDPLSEELRFLRAQLAIFEEVTQATNSSLILEDIFDALAEVLQRYIPYNEAVIVILDETQNAIKTLVRISDDGELDISGENHTFAGTDPILDEILAQALSTPNSRCYAQTKLPPSLVWASQAKTALAVPLINKGVVIGLITLSRFSDTAFDKQAEVLLNQISSQLALAVENARFYWQTQAQASREFLINQLTMAIRQSLEIDVILSTAVMELGKVMGVSRCFIRYFSDSANLDAPSDPSGENSQKRFGYHLPGIKPVTQEDFEQRIFQLRKEGTQPHNPFILNDVRDCPENLAPQSFFEENGIKSLAVIPILVGQTLVGTMTLHQCDAFRAWVMEDIELLKAMAEHLGVALHQASLFLTLDTQKRQLETTLEELQQAQLYLIQSEKMAVLGQFVAGIAHEVNTPLGTMISNNNTLKTCFGKLNDINQNKTSANNVLPDLLPVMGDLLDLNKLAAERIQDIVKNLRNFARLDESELKTVDVHEGIDSTLLVMKSSLNPNVQINKQYDHTIPAIQCYPGLLNQVFMNMLVNATHALDEKIADKKAGIITIGTRVSTCGQWVEIAFKDTGKGISPENLTRIFDPGFTTKGAGVGTGLGLALCYRIMEKHGGRITVESQIGQGSTFTVLLPVKV